MPKANMKADDSAELRRGLKESRNQANPSEPPQQKAAIQLQQAPLQGTTERFRSIEDLKAYHYAP
jgi:hypothetical protein